MESTLHQQLKQIHAPDSSSQEIGVGNYRVDAVVNDVLLEVQVSPLASLRSKVKKLLKTHQVRVIKPIVSRTFIVRYESKGKEILSSRYSPKRRGYEQLFEEMIHFVGPFPHPNLSLEVLLIEQTEYRKMVTKPTFRKKYTVLDRKLKSIVEQTVIRQANELLQFLPENLEIPFTTKELANSANLKRWQGQQMAWVLRKLGLIHQVEKRGNNKVYDWSDAA